ncbi:TIGR00341 family protein [Pseudalkalibacillus caeni]|uniref:TIGR00341 family protein n=1 Tax=Exobacillus caeni TaxID=2574798 RepID=A0A5R9EXX5_9BACL|nr:TIGR00341 family protein [Pseudalkalibacillus caeni]TLS35967.1 TIGR00341 family protein [Pseudalkalibacillus caeni]
MEVQLIEAYVPKKYFDKINESLQEFPHESYWVSNETDDYTLIRMLVKTTETEEILDYLENRVNVIEGFNVLLFPIQTFLTRKSEEEDKEKEKEKEPEDTNRLQRVSRQELLSVIQQSSKISLSYTLLVILSAIVVTVGFIRDSEAVVIGAMVIAPLLGPIISVAFAAILGNYRLVLQSLGTLFFAIVIVIFISILFSMALPVSINTHQFMSRTHVNLLDIVLALASGTAGALSTLRRLPGSLVGVMVAAALLPPTVVLGTTIGDAMWHEAYGSMLLLLVNITSVMLAAIIVFSLSGIQPIKWTEVQKANTSRRLSIIFVSAIVILLAIAILMGEKVDLT